MIELKDVITGLPDVASVDPNADYLVLVDTSGNVVGKINPVDLGVGGSGTWVLLVELLHLRLTLNLH
jgi:hypothetical protein